MAFVSVKEGAQEFAASVGDLRFLLFEPDDVKRPTAWQGPLRIQNQKSGTSCEADVSLVTAVYAAAEARVVIVVTYSGSLTYVHSVDVKTCKESSPTIKAYTEGVQVAGDRLTVQPGCECPAPKQACMCSAAQVFGLDPDFRAVLNEKESMDLTQRVLGVSFLGTKKVSNPRTPNAKLVEK